MNQSALHKGPTLGKFVLNGIARVWIAVGAAEVEEVLVEEREHILGQVSRLDGDRGRALRLLTR